MGNLNSDCHNCFGIQPKIHQTLLKAKDKPENSRTRESSAQDLDKFEKQMRGSNLTEEEYCSLDQPRESHIKKLAKYQRLSLEDFNLIRTIGNGSFGKIYLVEKKDNKKYYALKTMKKRDLVLKNLLKCALNEKHILTEIKHPFVVSLRCSFQTSTRVYMVMDYCNGGDLAARLCQETKFDEKTIKTCAAELVLAVEYLHEKLDIIHRDLKPANILISGDGHIKIADFGLAKPTSRALTFCGTLDYLAPEMIWGRAYGQEVDWWGLGCLLCEMAVGIPPFRDRNKDKLIAQIMSSDPKIPQGISSSFKSFLLKLLIKNPKYRLGAKGASEVKNHPFFKDIDWNALLNRELPPPFPSASIKKNSSLFYYTTTQNGSPLEADTQESSPGTVDITFPRFSYVSKDHFNETSEV